MWTDSGVGGGFGHMIDDSMLFLGETDAKLSRGCPRGQYFPQILHINGRKRSFFTFFLYFPGKKLFIMFYLPGITIILGAFN